MSSNYIPSDDSILLSNGKIVTPTSTFIGSIVTYHDRIIAVYKGEPIDEITAGKEIDCTGMIIG